MLMTYHGDGGPLRVGREGVFELHGIVLALPAYQGREGGDFTDGYLRGTEAEVLAIILITAHVAGGAIETGKAAQVEACGRRRAHIVTGRTGHQAVVVVFGTGKAHM